MKKIYRPLLKGINWILTVLLGLLGFSMTACIGIGQVEYGSPHATYTIKGKVTNTEGNAIPGIEITSATQYEKEWMQADPDRYPYKTLTNKDGEYILRLDTGGSSDFTVYATDIDGEANGSFQTDSVLVKGSEIKLTGGDRHWDMGHGETTANFTLKEEKPAEGE